jgi:hypothetical protein
MSTLIAPDMEGRIDYSNRCRNGLINSSMGPVSAAVILYIGERALTRAVNGQLLRRGISRKIRRLVGMICHWHMIYEVVYDMLEDM